MKYILILFLLLNCNSKVNNSVTPIDGLYVGKTSSVIIMDNILTLNTLNHYNILVKDNYFFTIEKNGMVFKWCYIYRQDTPLDVGYLITSRHDKCDKFNGWIWVSYKDQGN